MRALRRLAVSAAAARALSADRAGAVRDGAAAGPAGARDRGVRRKPLAQPTLADAAGAAARDERGANRAARCRRRRTRRRTGCARFRRADRYGDRSRCGRAVRHPAASSAAMPSLDDRIGRSDQAGRLPMRGCRVRCGAAPVAASAIVPARRKVVIIGNCQSETLRQGFAHIEPLNRLFDVRYHFIQLPKNLHEFAARDLETCDILLIQDIRLWDEFPLRDRVRPGADAVRFPLVRFASLWPFDAWNGPGDKRGARARGAEPDLPLSRRSARPVAPGNSRPRRRGFAPIARSTCRASSITAGCTNWKSAASAAWTRSSASRSAPSFWKISGPGGYSTRPCGRIGRCSTC